MTYIGRYYKTLHDWFDQSDAGDFEEFDKICGRRVAAAFDKLKTNRPQGVINWDKVQKAFICDTPDIARRIKNAGYVDYLDFLEFINTNGVNYYKVLGALDEAIITAVMDFVEDNKEEFLARK